MKMVDSYFQSIIVAFGGSFEPTVEGLSILDMLPEESKFDFIEMPNLHCQKYAKSGYPTNVNKCSQLFDVLKEMSFASVNKVTNN